LAKLYGAVTFVLEHPEEIETYVREAIEGLLRTWLAVPATNQRGGHRRRP